MRNLNNRWRVSQDELRTYQLFDGVENETLEYISKHCVISTLEAKENLYTQRGGIEYLYVICSGYVTMYIPSQFSSDAETFLAWLGPQQIIGENKPIGEKPSEAIIITCDPCEFIEIRSDVFEDAANNSKKLYRNIARLLVKKMEHERCRSEIIRMSSAIRQVAQTLLHLAHDRCGDERLKHVNSIEIPGIIDQNEIGSYVGIKRETTNKQLMAFKNAQLIQCTTSNRGSIFTILNKEMLEKVARGELTKEALEKITRGEIE